MKNSRMRFIGVLAATALTLTGCGEALYVMTPEEEAAVVSYASHALAKFNKNQSDGSVHVPKEVLEGTDSQEETGDVSTEAPLDEGSQEEVTAPDVGSQNGELQEEPEVSLNQALDLGPILAECVGTEFVKSYQDTEYSAVDAGQGKQLLVVKVNLTNQSEQALHVDVLSMTPTFVLLMNDTVKVPVQVTILLNDLSTFQGDIAGNGVVETVLLFQIPEDVTEVSSMQLSVTMDGSNMKVNL